MLHTFVAMVQDKPGVLTRVASLFRRLNINIVSLTVGESERTDVSRMTIVCEAPDHAAHRDADEIEERDGDLLARGKWHGSGLQDSEVTLAIDACSSSRIDWRISSSVERKNERCGKVTL